MGPGEGARRPLTSIPDRLQSARLLAGALTVSAVTDLAIAVSLRDRLVSRVAVLIGPGLRAAGTALTDRDLGAAAEGYVYVGLAAGGVIALAAFLVAAATLRGPGRGALWVGTALLGVVALVPTLLMLPLPYQATADLPVAMLLVGLTVSLLDVGVFALSVARLTGWDSGEGCDPRRRD